MTLVDGAKRPHVSPRLRRGGDPSKVRAGVSYRDGDVNGWNGGVSGNRGSVRPLEGNVVCACDCAEAGRELCRGIDFV